MKAFSLVLLFVLPSCLSSEQWKTLGREAALRELPIVLQKVSAKNPTPVNP